VLSFFLETEIMKTKFILITILLTLIVSCGNVKKNDSSTENSETTTYYLIRHSEKDRSNPENRNPDLSTEGQQRAERWADYFSDKNIEAVYSTNYNRTIQTATPTAEANNLEIQFYDPTNMYDDAFIKETKGKNVLVLGHSNTTPQFANKIIGKNSYEDMDDTDNASLFIVTITGDNREVTVSKLD